MPAPPIGFVGFGEAGSRIAMGLRQAGAAEMAAYDSAADAPVFGERIRARARESGVRLVESNAELAAASTILLSVVTAASALDATRQNAAHLQPHHFYVDCNSVSPQTKREIAAVILAGPAKFVEAAILAPVPKQRGQSVPMLTGGEDAAALADALAPLGFCMEPVPGGFGTAAAVKMCRSIVVKGLEALLTECVLAASRFGAEERVFASLQQSYPGIQWMQLADYMVNRLALHGERRAREMEEVAATLRAVGVEPIMAEAAARRQEWGAKLGLPAHFGPAGPDTYREVVEVVETIKDKPG